MKKLIEEVRKAYEELRQLAEEAGINKDLKESENEIPSMRVIHDRLIELGQNVGSYRKALNIYYENGVIDEVDALELRGTHFCDLLFEELKKDNYFGQNIDESTIWKMEIL